MPIKATVNGAEYRGTIVPMAGKYMLGIPKVFREAGEIKDGDNIVVTLEEAKQPETRTRRLEKTLALLRVKAKS